MTTLLLRRGLLRVYIAEGHAWQGVKPSKFEGFKPAVFGHITLSSWRLGDTSKRKSAFRNLPQDVKRHQSSDKT